MIKYAINYEVRKTRVYISPVSPYNIPLTLQTIFLHRVFKHQNCNIIYYSKIITRPNHEIQFKTFILHQNPVDMQATNSK